MHKFFALLLITSCSHIDNTATPLLSSAEELQVEHAVKVCPEDEANFLESFDLSKNDKREKRKISFFDTPQRDLKESGLVLRIRQKPDEVDVAIKVRPYTDTYSSDWNNSEGFKCEIDRTHKTNIQSCSLTTEIRRSLFKNIMKGNKELEELFNDEANKAFLAEFAEKKIDWNPIINPKRSINVVKWKKKIALLPDSKSKVAFEFWDLRKSPQIYEVSTRSSRENSDATWQGLIEYINRSGLEVCDKQVSKTMQALAELE